MLSSVTRVSPCNPYMGARMHVIQYSACFFFNFTSLLTPCWCCWGKWLRRRRGHALPQTRDRVAVAASRALRLHTRSNTSHKCTSFHTCTAHCIESYRVVCYYIFCVLHRTTPHPRFITSQNVPPADTFDCLTVTLTIWYVSLLPILGSMPRTICRLCGDD